MSKTRRIFITTAPTTSRTPTTVTAVVGVDVPDVYNVWDPDVVALFDEYDSTSYYSVNIVPSHHCLNLSLCLNATNSTDASLEGDIDRNFWSFFLLIFPLLTVFGNVLVVLSVYRERSLQTVTNYYIVSLAIADIMVATFVMPLSVYVEVCICPRLIVERY